MLEISRVESFRQDGFTAAPSIGDPSELSWITELCDRSFAKRKGHAPAAMDLPSAEVDAASLTTIVSPEGDEPQLSEAQMVRDAREMAAQLFDVQTQHVWLGWRLFVKPVGAEATPWHQDAAYRPPPHCGATFWIPIDVPETSTLSLRFIPGSHLGPLQPHDWDHGHASIRDVADELARDNPVGRGEASIHHCLTLHAAGPNRAQTTRRAIALVCQIET